METFAEDQRKIIESHNDKMKRIIEDHHVKFMSQIDEMIKTVDSLSEEEERKEKKKKIDKKKSKGDFSLVTWLLG
jgi:hypothetical protein